MYTELKKSLFFQAFHPLPAQTGISNHFTILILYILNFFLSQLFTLKFHIQTYILNRETNTPLQ